MIEVNIHIFQHYHPFEWMQKSSLNLYQFQIPFHHLIYLGVQLSQQCSQKNPVGKPMSKIRLVNLYQGKLNIRRASSGVATSRPYSPAIRTIRSTNWALVSAKTTLE